MTTPSSRRDPGGRSKSIAQGLATGSTAHSAPGTPDSGLTPFRRPRRSFGWAILVGLIIVGGALLIGGGAMAPVPSPLVRLLGAALCVYSIMLLLTWYPVPLVARPVEKFFEGVLDRSQSGWYVVVAMGQFARAELASLWERGTSGIESGQSPWHWLAIHLSGFSVDTFMNGLWATLWPIRAMQEFGMVTTAVFMGVVYGLYQFGARTLGEPRLRLDAGSGEESEAAAPTPASRGTPD